MSRQIKANDFPKNQDFEAKMKYMLSYAILAQNSHNTQPWKFEIDKKNRYLYIYLDWQRTLQYSDRYNREAYISLGCALANLIVALDYFNFLYSIEYFPEDSVKDIAIRIKVDTKQKDGMPLYDSGIPSPITILAPFLIKTVPPKLQAATNRRLVAESSSLLILTSENNDRTSWIKAGKVYELLALAGTAHSLFVSAMAGIIEHEDSCYNLRKSINIEGNPIFFARISYVNKTPQHSPRRL